MEKQSLVIDNAGFDVEAMSAMSEKEFVDLHLENDAICRGGTDQERKAWLKDAHKRIKAVSTSKSFVVAKREE